MATATLTNTPTSIADGESVTGWSGDTFSLEPDIKVEGSNSVACAQTASGDNDAIFTKATGSWDFSGGEHIRLWFNSTAVPTYANNAASGGIQVGLGDGTNTDYFYVGGADTYGGGWEQIVLYSLATPDVDNGANLAAITNITWRMNVHTKPRNVPANLWLDAWSFGDGYTVTGGTSGDPIDWSHIAAADAVSAYGVVSEVNGVYFAAGEITIGNSTLTSPEPLTYFEPSGQLLMFKDLPVNTGLYQVIFADGAASPSLTYVDISSGAWSAAGTQRFKIDASTICKSFAIDGLQVSRGADGSSFHAGALVANTVFNDCLQVDPSTATFTNNTFSNSTATDGALYWNGSSNTSNIAFINNLRGVEVTQTTNQSFTNMVFDDLTGSPTPYDVHLNNGGTDIDISNTGTSNANSYIATGGGTVTFVGASVTIKATATTTDGTPIQSAQVLVRAVSMSPEGPFPVSESVTIARTGSPESLAVVSHTGHGMLSGDWVQIDGANQAEYNGVKVITVIDANSYSYVTDTSPLPTTPATGTITATYVALYGTTDVNGEVSTTRVYSSAQDVTGWSRKMSGTPYYKEGVITGTISTTTGLDKTAVMALDE